jgi:hypothetical protein
MSKSFDLDKAYEELKDIGRAAQAEAKCVQYEARIRDLLQYAKSLEAAYNAVRNERDMYKEQAARNGALLKYQPLPPWN